MTQAAPKAPAPRRPLWAGPLVAGVCFGVAYGITQRLVAVNVGELIRFGQRFDVQEFPGTSLESLRLRFGAADAELRGNLELQQLERQPEPATPTEPERPAEPAASTPPAATEPATPSADATPAPEPPAAPAAAASGDAQPAAPPPAPAAGRP